MYTVPIIAPDLRHEETIIQAAHALNVLQQTIDKVFQCLDSRIAVNSAKAKNLGMRIQSADERIRKLVGVKKAVQIYAPARYPASHLLHDPAVTFDMQIIDEERTQQEQHEKFEIKSHFESSHSESRHEKLVFFHLSTPINIATLKSGAFPEHVTAARVKLNSNGHTLGAPPQNLSSIVSLLRFNTEEEAYNTKTTNEQGAVRPDSWRRAKMPKNLQKPQQKVLEPAPHSLANRNQRATPAGDLRYMPKMHEAPIIDLPMDLPSLDGVAQDIHFLGFGNAHANIEVKIEKIIRQENVSTLPKIQQQNEVEEQLSSEVINTTTTISPIQKSQTKAAVPTNAPPPPPPPPPPAMTTVTPTTSLNHNQSKLSNTNATDTRSALMDAIRQAGGAGGGRLRSAAAAPVDVTDNKKKATVSSSGNLMDDLHNKLLMRRKGISGSSTSTTITNNNMSNSNPVLQRLSALIPPPPSNKPQHSDGQDPTNNTEDGDWE